MLLLETPDPEKSVCMLGDREYGAWTRLKEAKYNVCQPKKCEYELNSRLC